MNLTAWPPQVFLLASTLFAATGQVLFKLGSAGLTSIDKALNPAILGGLALYAISTVLWIAGLSRISLASAYPFTALTFLLVTLAAIVLFNERPGVFEIGGAVLVLVGLAMMTLGASPK